MNWKSNPIVSLLFYRLAIISFAALHVNQLDLATKSTSEMKDLHIDSIPTLISYTILSIYLKNLSLWEIPIPEEENSIDQSLNESVLALQETLESYGGPISCPQLINICNIASCLLNQNSLPIQFPSDPQFLLNSIWLSYRNGDIVPLPSK